VGGSDDISLLTSSGPSLWTIMGLLKMISYLLCFALLSCLFLFWTVCSLWPFQSDCS